VTRLATFVLAGALMAACSSTTPCSVARDCPASQRCMNRVCADLDGTPGALGESCRANGDCSSGLSCTVANLGYPGGFCSASCTESAPCGTGVCTPIGSAQLCTPTCTTDTECRQGYGCCPTLGNVCIPLAACTPPACTRPVVTSALPPAQVQQFGTKKVGEEVSFIVPPDTGSVTIVEQAQIANLTIVYRNSVLDNSAVPLTITKPDGGLAYDDMDAGAGGVSSPDGGTDPSGEYAFYGGATPSTVAFTIPNTSASLNEGVPAGTWKFVVNDYANECTFIQGCSDGGTTSNTYDVSVLTRPAPQGTDMEVAFYIVADMNTASGAPFTAANAAADLYVQQMVQTFKRILANAGITASVTFYDVSATERARFGTNISADTTGPCSELCQMFTLSGTHPGTTMNLFLVQSLRSASSGGNTVVGIDGTIPGPSSLNGTVQSGAVVSAADLFGGSLQNCGSSLNIGSCGPDRVAYIGAHETGHFLGLFHTTEQEGADFDPLTDTPKCPCTTCADPSERSNCGANSVAAPFLTARQCIPPSAAGCGGGDNLMFWLLQAGASAGTLTSEQAKVMRLNLLVQ
jgi:hypothetical protein